MESPNTSARKSQRSSLTSWMSRTNCALKARESLAKLLSSMRVWVYNLPHLIRRVHLGFGNSHWRRPHLAQRSTWLSHLLTILRASSTKPDIVTRRLSLRLKNIFAIAVQMSELGLRSLLGSSIWTFQTKRSTTRLLRKWSPLSRTSSYSSTWVHQKKWRNDLALTHAFLLPLFLGYRIFQLGAVHRL